MAEIIRSAKAPLRVRLLTVVWGAEFLDRFVRLALRTLLAPGNLPAVASRNPVVWSFFTTAEDAERLRAHPLFSRLPKSVDFRIQTFRLTEINPKNPSSHWILWQRGIAEAQAADDCVITVAADHVFGENTLMRWVDLFEQGKLAIFSPGIQVALETLEEEFAQYPAGDPLILPEARMVDLMFRHLHPVNITMFRGSPRWMMHPEYVLRALPGAGFTQNILTSHAVAFRPAAIAMTETFCPTEKLDDVAYEPSRFLSAEPLLKNLPLYYRRWRMDDVTLSHFGHWGDTYFTPANIEESKIAHAYLFDGTAATELVRCARQASAFYIAQMQISRSIYRLWKVLRDAGLYSAARWLAAAHIYGRFRREPSVRPATIFAPAEEALRRLLPGEVHRLMANGGVALKAALRDHVAAGKHALHPGDRLAPSADGPIMTANGRRYAVAPDGSVKIAAGPISVDDFDIFVIDRPLAEVTLTPRSAKGRVQNTTLRIRHSARRVVKFARDSALRVTRRHYRLYEALQKCRDLLEPKAAPVRSPDADAIENLRRALRASAVSSLRELYAFYDAAVLAGALRSRPAEVVNEIDIDEPLDLLRKAVKAEPNFCEAWLELGHHCLRTGQQSEAMRSFEQALRTAPMLPLSRRAPDPRSMAALELSRIYERQGHREEALRILETGMQYKPLGWHLHLQKGQLLLDLGRPGDASVCFERCMVRDDITPDLSGLLPRRLSELMPKLPG